MIEINSGILEVPVSELKDMHIKQLSEQLISDYEKLVLNEYYPKIKLSQRQRSESIAAVGILIKYINLPDHIFERQHNREMVNRSYLKLEKITLLIQDVISKELNKEIKDLVKEKSHVTKTNS